MVHDEKKILLKLYDMEQAFQKLAYESNHHLYMPDKNKHFYNMFASYTESDVSCYGRSLERGKSNEENVKSG